MKILLLFGTCFFLFSRVVGGWADPTITAVDLQSGETSEASLRFDPESIYVTPDGLKAYVMTEDDGSDECSIDVIDTKDLSVMTRILSSAVKGFAFSPDGSKAYIATKGTLKVLDTSSDTMADMQITEGSLGDMPFTVSPDGSKIYAIVESEEEETDGIAVIDTSVGVEVDRILTDTIPISIAVSPDGSRVYASTVRHTLSVIDAVENSILRSGIKVGLAPHTMAVTPDGSKICILGIRGKVGIFRTATESITFLKIGGNDAFVSEIVITPDGSKAYVSVEDQNEIHIVDLNAESIVGTISVVSDPDEMAMSVDGTKVCVVGDTGMTVIDVETDQIITTVSWIRPGRLGGLALTPDGTRAFVMSYQPLMKFD